MSPRDLGTVFLRLLGLLLLYQATVAWLPKLVSFTFSLPAPTRVVAEQLAHWLVAAAPPLAGGAACLLFAPWIARRLFPAGPAAVEAIGARTLCLVGVQVLALGFVLARLGPLVRAWLDWRAVSTNPRISPEMLALELPPLERACIAEASVVGAAVVLLLIARPLAHILAPRETT